MFGQHSRRDDGQHGEGGEPEQPRGMLPGMEQANDETTAIVGGNRGNGCIARCPAQSHDKDEGTGGLVQHPGSSKERAGGEGEGDQGRKDQSAGAPTLEVH